MLNLVMKAYKDALMDTDRERAFEVINNAIDKGIAPEDILFKVVIPSIDMMFRAVSESFDANLAQHFMTSQIAVEATEVLTAKFKIKPQIVGCVVIGTSQGDFHGLGKKIVSGCLKAYFIDVIDLGLNVSPERFVDEAVANNAQVIAISSMMVHTARGENGCLKVRQILKERGLEDRIKITVGGAPYRFDHELWKKVQADAWAATGIEAADVIINLIKEVKNYDRDGKTKCCNQWNYR